MKNIKIKNLDKIFYTEMHDKYGHAEFHICPIFKYGKLKKVMIYRRQQETNECYEIEAQNQTQFLISSWTHLGIEHPNIWRTFWCKEHKTICFDVYVPKNTNAIEIENYSSFNLRFIKGEPSK